MKKATLYFLGLGVIAAAFSACTSGGDNPGIEYAPDMYVSKGYEPFSQVRKSEYNPYGMTMRLPVAGTIARGQMSYIYPHVNTSEGYEASAGFTNPHASTKTFVFCFVLRFGCWRVLGHPSGPHRASKAEKKRNETEKG